MKDSTLLTLIGASIIFTLGELLAIIGEFTVGAFFWAFPTDKNDKQLTDNYKTRKRNYYVEKNNAFSCNRWLFDN